jgi:phosphoketolase
MDQAVKHCDAGIGIWEWASNDGREPDVVMACAGDVPTLETLAAVDLLREHLPELQGAGRQRRRPHDAAAAEEHPHGLSDRDFDALFTTTSRSSSPTTATRGSSTASPTGARTTATCTCAATRRRARPPRPSTWRC